MPKQSRFTCNAGPDGIGTVGWIEMYWDRSPSEVKEKGTLINEHLLLAFILIMEAVAGTMHLIAQLSTVLIISMLVANWLVIKSIK